MGEVTLSQNYYCEAEALPSFIFVAMHSPSDLYKENNSNVTHDIIINSINNLQNENITCWTKTSVSTVNIDSAKLSQKSFFVVITFTSLALEGVHKRLGL